MGYYSSSPEILVVWFMLAAAACSPLVVHFILIYLSLTVWAKHIRRPEYMGRALRAIVAAAILPVLAVPVIWIAWLVTDSSFHFGIDWVFPVVLVSAAVLVGVLVPASLLCFMAAILPESASSGSGKVPVPTPAKPAKEPWDD